MVAAIPLIEEVYCPDVFVSGIGKIEKLDGGMVRIVVYADRRGEGGRIERVVTGRMVGSLSRMPTAVRMLALAMADVGVVIVADAGELTTLN